MPWRGGLGLDKTLKAVESCIRLTGFDMRNIYLQRMLMANIKDFKEINNMSETAVKELFMEVVDRNGWYKEREVQLEAKRNREIAREMLANNEPIEKIAKYTGLSVDDIRNLQQPPV